MKIKTKIRAGLVAAPGDTPIGVGGGNGGGAPGGGGRLRCC